MSVFEDDAHRGQLLFETPALTLGLLEAAGIGRHTHGLGQLDERHVVADLEGQHDGNGVGVGVATIVFDGP